MSEGGVKGSAEIKAALDALKGTTGDDAVDKAEKLAELVSAGGVRAFCECGVVEGLKAMLGDRATSEAAFRAITALCQVMTFKAEPFMVPFLPNVLSGVADKKSKEVREAAEEAGPCIIAICSAQASKNVQPFLFAGIAETNWQTKMWSLRLLGQFAEQSESPFARTLYQVVPIVSAAMWDTKKEVKQAAKDATLQALETCQNRDIRPFIPAVIEAIENPAEVPETLHKLSSTVFVQSVDNPALSIAVPILMRGTQEKKIESKRRVCVIADNMCKLIDYAHEATTFMPELMPAIARLAEEMSDPEARQMANKALKTLKNIEESAASFEAAKTMEPEQVVKIIQDAIKATVADNWSKWLSTDNSVRMSIEYAGVLLSGMIAGMLFSEDDWKFQGLCPYLAPYMSETESQEVCKIVFKECYKSCVPKETQEDEHEEGEDLCNCEFSLGYGAKILLNNTRLHLKRGKRYGVCGHNGCGKSTLMKAIANGQVENFPPPEQLKTVYVEHDIQGDLSDLNLIDYVCALCPDIPRDTVFAELIKFGFVEDPKAPACIHSCISGLSGGWKMKLALCRAILQNADILLLDEPTNHLDVTNVAWLKRWLTSQHNVTCLVVSHDSGFLDEISTHVIQFEKNRKLKTHLGNLTAFVSRTPEAKAYFELASEQLAFKLPNPGFLEGVNSKGKPILKMEKVYFTYPGLDKPTVKNIALSASLASRVAVIGPNGAGKSTIIKILTGELKADEGSVWRHPNMRVAYVAQHAFHHLERHQDKTPNEYIQWRYAGGEDKESLTKEANQVSEDEKAKMANAIEIETKDGLIEKRVVEEIIGRKKLKNGYEYEIKWVGKNTDQNEYVEREKLIAWGFTKMVQRFDEREALRLGTAGKALTAKNVEEALGNMGLEAEFATHNRVRGLSGGQKVKVVLAAAMWEDPHILVLDEPTNYLDRDSLGALATAIKSYEGGVIMISHNREFTSALCPETWICENGQLRREGESYVEDVKLVNPDDPFTGEKKTVQDAFGNTITLKKKKLTGAALKKYKKMKEARRKRGEEVSVTESDDE
eukprot:Tamp_02990.p1 GENE.Tamp_02990~~Tamp_02990.p1  ORF type:complete len:1090 (-),score=365.00 Tamp_02990:699-3854(-)